MTFFSFEVPLVLASSSTYRAQALTRLGLEFTQVSPDIDESAAPGEAPQILAQRLAREKTSAIRSQRPDAIIIGSDQVGVAQGRQLQKPGSHKAAIAQLQHLSGAEAVFHTGLAVFDPTNAEIHEAVTTTRIKFRCLTDDQIRRYVEIDQPLDCAGSFKVEALGIALFEKVASDDPTALVGIPMIALVSILQRLSASEMSR